MADDVETSFFLKNSFYVDDGLHSTNTVAEAARVLTNSRRILHKYHIRLHKISSNNYSVLEKMPISEISEGSKLFQIGEFSYSSKTLGVQWNQMTDEFSIQSNNQERPFTRRGVLSVINSIYDPLGMVSPIVLGGRLIQRQIFSSKLSEIGWDDDLPTEFLNKWKKWIQSLHELDTLRMKRCLVRKNFVTLIRELHVYVDASEEAIGYAVYMKSQDANGDVVVRLVEGGSKVAPRAASTIPRLELCAALEAVLAVGRLIRELRDKPVSTRYYSDSMVVLGYLNNTTTRFSNYVARRVSIILNNAPSREWFYVPTAENPADLATRPQTPAGLKSSIWFLGPNNLYTSKEETEVSQVIPVQQLPEYKPVEKVMKTSFNFDSPLSTICTRLSEYSKIIRVTMVLIELQVKFDQVRQRSGVPLAPRDRDIHPISAELQHVRNAQREVYKNEIELLQKSIDIPETSGIVKYNPFLDHHGIMRVGGRLRRANLPFIEQHPVLLPSQHPFVQRLVDFVHREVNHQGFKITLGGLIQRGYIVDKGSSLIKKLIYFCVSCRRLRGKPQTQRMADLPEERVEQIQPFSSVGVDVFGPFIICDGAYTRRNSYEKKVWVLIVVCGVSRAIHLEPLPAMDVSSLQNAIRRFVAVRGVFKSIRSDRGTNFVCARTQLCSSDIVRIASDLHQSPPQWTLNPAGASHFGGSWERKIGSVRSVMEGALLSLHNRLLSRDEFSTLLQEASAIVNNTPFGNVSSDLDGLPALSPANLLTAKLTPNPPPIERFSQADILCYGKRRWRRVQILAEEFWRRWRLEYLQDLQCRSKWVKSKQNVRVGDIVLVKEKNCHRNVWPMARVSNVKKSHDGLVRSVTLVLPPLRGDDQTATRKVDKCIHDAFPLFQLTLSNCPKE